jgi:hypothetical protein
MNALVPAVAGCPEPTSVLDGHLLARRDFRVRWSDGRFLFCSEWSRRANVLSPELERQLKEEGVPSRWRHEEHVWECTPVRNRKTGAWAGFNLRSVSRPPGSKEIYPREKRRVEVEADFLSGVLAAAEERLAAALREDEDWLRRTTRST